MSATIDDERLAAEKKRLHVEDGDYFAFRSEAHEQAEALTTRLGTAGATQDWCEEMMRLYGSRGAAVPDVLRR